MQFTHFSFSVSMFLCSDFNCDMSMFWLACSVEKKRKYFTFCTINKSDIICPLGIGFCLMCQKVETNRLFHIYYGKNRIVSSCSLGSIPVKSIIIKHV